MKGLFEPQIGVTAKALDLRLERQNLVMSNIANVATPGYKARRLEFEDSMQKALDLDARGRMTKTNSMHVPSVFSTDTFKGEELKAFKPRVVHGEDSVNVDKEMTVMAKNAMLYNALSDVIKKDFENLQKVIADGGR